MEQKISYRDIQGNEKDERRGMFISVAIHLLLLLICLLPMLSHLEPPVEIAGIYVQFGDVEEGGNEEIPASQNEVREEEKITADEPKVEAVKEAKSTPQKTKVETSPILDDESPVVKKETPVSQPSESKVDLEAKRKAEEAAKKKEQAEQKQKYSDLFKSGGKGKGNQTGDEGKKSGDPNANVLDNLASGSGRIGGGLTNRGVVHEPRIRDNTQKTGKVAINICVDSDGNVIKAEYTQKGSTTTDSHLKKIAEEGVKKYKFSKSNVKEQCGSIIIDFEVE
jgi:outer membrane biosynthesis protein TonB